MDATNPITSKKILIAEDESIIAMELSYCLDKMGYQVTSVVDSGEKCIKKTELDQPDLILMDIRLKGDLDGIEAATAIRSRFDIPIVFLTAFLDTKRLAESNLTIPFDYLLKPVREKDLQFTIEMACYLAETQIQKKKKQCRRLTETMPFSYQSLDANGCFIEVNESWLQQLGYARKDVIGKSFGDFVCPQWKNQFEAIFPCFKSLGEVIGIECKLVKKDGSILPVSFDGKIGYDKDGNFMQTHCIFKEIEDPNEMEAYPITTKTKWKALLATIPDQTIVVDLEGRIEYINFTRENDQAFYIGKLLFDFLNDEGRLLAKRYMQKALETGCRQVSYFTHQFSDGNKRTFISHLSPIRLAADVTGFTITNKDT